MLIIQSIENQEKEKQEEIQNDNYNSETINSETFIGRNLLVKMGWENGMKLGKSGGIANEPIQVTIKQDKSGIGIKKEQEEIKINQSNKKRKNEHNDKTNVLNVTRMRYYNNNNEDNK